MDPNKWGSYGWKMIHTYSRLPVDLGDYIRWLKATSKILPCRKCRQNFKKHIESHICKPAKSTEYLSICLHNAVSNTLDRSYDDKTKQSYEYKIDDLPEISRENLFQPEFWSTIYLNTTIGKDKVIQNWLKETRRILRKGKMVDEAVFVDNLLKSEYLPKTKQDKSRRVYLRKVIQDFQKDMNVRRLSYSQELSRLGKSLRPRATRKRVRILSRKEPSGRTRRLSRNLQ